MTNTAPPDVLVVDHPVEVSREYDFNKGDLRRFDRDEAIRIARGRVAERGCRQQVRLSSAPLLGGDPIWLIQDI